MFSLTFIENYYSSSGSHICPESRSANRHMGSIGSAINRVSTTRWNTMASDTQVTKDRLTGARWPVLGFSSKFRLDSASVCLIQQIVIPQVALGRQCAHRWSMSLASTCTAWLCPTFPAVANLMSCSRSMASIAMPSPRQSAKCSAAPPTPSNFALGPTHPPTCLPDHNAPADLK